VEYVIFEHNKSMVDQQYNTKKNLMKNILLLRVERVDSLQRKIKLYKVEKNKKRNR